MTPAEQLNAIIDVIETRVATALDISADQIYETRQTGEGEGAAAYVSANIDQLVPHTGCAERAAVTVTIGFHMPEIEGERQRVTRVNHTMALRDALLWRASNAPNAIPNVGLPQVLDMAVSEMGDPDRNYIMGGLTYQFQTILDKPS